MYLFLALILFPTYSVMFGVWGAIYGVTTMISSAIISD
jgi:hypothetical protein